MSSPEGSVSAGVAIPRPSLASRLRADRLIRNNAIYLTGSVAVGAFGYIFHFATGRLLGPATYAIIASMVSALSLLSLPSLVLQTTAARFVSLSMAHADEGAVRRLLLRLTVVCALGIVVGAAILAALAPALANYLHLADTRFVYLLVLASSVALLVSILRGAMQGLSRFLLLSVNTLLDMASRVVVAVGLIIAGLGAIGGAAAIAAGPIVAYAQSLFALRRFIRSKKETSLPLSDVGRYSISAMVAAAGITYLLNIDVILAKHYLPGHESGIYAAGAVLGRVIYFLGMTVAAVMFPEVTLRHARGEAHFLVVEKSLLLLIVMSGGLVLGYAVLPGLVIGPFGQSFVQAGSYLVFFAVALSLFAIAVLFVNYFLSINSPRFIGPLLLACLLDTALITAFHASAIQVVSMVMISMAVLLAALGALYAADRFGLSRAAA